VRNNEGGDFRHSCDEMMLVQEGKAFVKKRDGEQVKKRETTAHVSIPIKREYESRFAAFEYLCFINV